MSNVTGLIFASLMLAQPVGSPTCQEWNKAAHIGELDSRIDEASGLAVSAKFPGRLYHVNDSGDTGRFYITDMQGRDLQTVSVSGFRPRDVEDLGYGSCGGDGQSCLFIADIGDNHAIRKTVDLVVVEELKNFPKTVQPQYHVKLRYPDRAHDAESLALHPDGTIFILTKERPARLYKLAKDQWQSRGGPIQTLSFVTTLDTPALPTSIDISPDGKTLLVLTYVHALEFEFDSLHPGQHKKAARIPLTMLQQQEAVAYLPTGKSFIYTTERFILPMAWIMQMSCIR